MAGAGFLSLRCPGCGAASDRVPATLAGRTVRCPRCSLRFTAEAPAPTVPEEGSLAPTRPETRPAARPPAPGWQPGDVILGLYEVRGVLGEGGMGRVFRVRHRGWSLDLAVKVPLPAALDAAGGADLFEREAEAWVGLGLHPNVVTCHYVRRDAGLPLVFAECVDGGSLHGAIRGRRLASAEAILDVGVQFAWGLHHAHEQGLVHRDVKPANVLLTRDGVARVTDFGLARARPARLAAPAAGSGHTLTVDGGGGGTPAYFSPEQAAGRAQTRRSDVWSFGLSLLEAFLGGRTWEYGLVAPEVLDGYRAAGLGVEGQPRMPEAVADLLSRCFRERPEERPHDLTEVAAALRDAWETAAGRPYPRPLPRGGPGSADALNNRALSLVDLGRADEASRSWDRALAADAQHVESVYNAGLAAWRDGRTADPELLRRMEEASRAHAGRARAQQLLGRVHLALRQAPDALLAFERAARLGGTDDLAPDLESARAGFPPPPRTLRGLPSAVAALVVTPDGRTVVAGGGREVRAWDATSGQLLRTLPVPDGEVRALATLEEGRFLLVGAEGAPLTVWDLLSGRPVRSWARHTGFTTSLAVAEGGSVVVAGGSDRVVRLWDPGTGRVVRDLAGHEDAVTSVAAGATCAASASRDGAVRLWSLETGEPIATLAGHSGRVLAVALDERRDRVVSAGDDGTLRTWSPRSRAALRVCRSHGQAATCAALANDGARALSGSSDRTVRGFEAAGGPIDMLVRLDASVAALAVAPDGTTWAAHGAAVSALPANGLNLPPPVLCRPSSASEVEERASAFEAGVAEARRSLADGDLATAVSLARKAREIPGHERSHAALDLWDGLVARLPRRALLSAWESEPLEGHRDAALAVSMDGTGHKALAGGLDGTLRVWSLGAQREPAVLTGHDGAVTAVAAAGADRALSGGRDGSVRLWDLTAGTAVRLEGHGDTVAALDATADGALAASASHDGTARIWDLRRGEQTRRLEGHGAPVSSVRLSPDGRVLVSGGWDGSARLWDALAGLALGTLAGHGGAVTAVALHADGRKVATGAQDGVVRLFDARTGREERRLGGHEAEVTGLAFTPDGRFLVSGSRDRSVRVFDLRSGTPARTLPHPALVLGLALAPGANVLLTAGGDGLVRRWHLDWEPDTTAPPVPSAVRATPRATAPTVPSPALPLPRRRVPWGRVRWRRVALGTALLAVAASAWLVWRTPPAPVRLSPHMREAVPRELDLVDLAPYRDACSPGDYERHLDSLRGGDPDARDIACIAARGTASVVSDVLEGAPLSADDPLVARRRRRNAASALAGLRGEAVDALCAYLGDERDGARRAAGDALAVADDPAASSCLREALVSGEPPAPGAAAAALRQRLVRGLFPVDEAWALVRLVAVDPTPGRRAAGLSLLPLFTADRAAPVARALLDDPDPDVAAAAREALDAIERVRRTDQMRGDPD